MPTDPEDLLRRLAANDDPSLRIVLAPTPEFDHAGETPAALLDRGTRVLVRLGALIALDACTDSLRWAVELAAATGAQDEEFLQVLSVAASAAGSVQAVAIAPKLALALGFDPGAGDSDEG